MIDGRTVRRSRSGRSRMTLAKAVAILGVIELAIIAVLIIVPFAIRGAVEIWQIALSAALLVAASSAFVALSFVKNDGKWQWRWGPN